MAPQEIRSGDMPANSVEMTEKKWDNRLIVKLINAPIVGL